MTDSKLSECGIKCLPEPDGSGHHADCRYSVAEPPVPSDDALRRTYYGNCLARQFCDGLRDVWRDGWRARDAARPATARELDGAHPAWWRGHDAAEKKLKGRIASLERDVASWRGDYEECSRQRAALEPRIAELEAENTRLKNTVESLYILRERAQLRGQSSYGAHQRETSRVAELEAVVAELREVHRVDMGNLERLMEQLMATPRRTPELTERVAKAIYARKPAWSVGGDGWKVVPWEHLSPDAQLDVMHEAIAYLDVVFGKERV